MPAKSSPKSMDIQKPGDAKPDSSARPILVTNRPILQDPMVKDSSNKTPEDNEEKDTNLASTSKTIEPPKGTQKPETTDEKPEDATEAVGPEAKEMPKTVDSIPEGDDIASSDSAVVDAVVAGATKPGDTADASQIEVAETKRKQAVQMLVDSKKYFVPIGKASRARHNRNAIVLLAFMLALVIGYAVIDLGVVKVPFELPVHIFKNLI